MTTFTSRADEVTRRVGDLGLGAVVPTAYDDLAAADRSVEDAVDRVRAGLSPAVDLDELAADLVAGRIKPETAAKRLNAPAGARVSNLLDRVREHAVSGADRPEWTPTALRRSCVPIVRDRLQRTADDMLATLAGLPAVVKDHLSQVVETDSGTIYGALTADAFADALSWIAPSGDLASVRPADLASVQAAQAAWSWWNEAHTAFEPLYWLGTGREVRRGWDTNDVTGDGATEAKTFDPAVLLVSGEAVDYVAAGVPLAFAVAAGLIESFDVVADPFGTGEDAEAYQARVDRFAAYRQWVGEARETVNAGAAHLAGRDRMDELKRRAELPALDAVEQFRAQL